MRKTASKPVTHTKTRYIVEYDQDANFEECNGEPRSLTEAEYRENGYRACPHHWRAGTVVIKKKGPPQVQGCAVCQNTAYEDIPYTEYLAYYGNPDRHVYLSVTREDQCSHCGEWSTGDSLHRIDVMDDQPEASMIGTFTLAELSGYLQEVAEDLDADKRF